MAAQFLNNTKKQTTYTILSVVIFFLSSCKTTNVLVDGEKNQEVKRNYRDDMRSFVINLSGYAKAKNPNFGIIPQNGIELVTLSDNSDGAPSKSYLNAIDAHGQESLFYGYSSDNKKTPTDANQYLIDYLKISQQHGKAIFVTDYCSSKEKINQSYINNSNLGFTSFQATERDLTIVPTVYQNKNNKNIVSLNDAQNFVFFLNYENYSSKSNVVEDVANSNYDLVLIDLFFNDGTQFSQLDITKMKTKPNGGKRLVYCYMSIGEAEDYRFYWNSEWKSKNLDWLDKENKNWPGNYKVKYWNKDWQNIIFGFQESYLDKIISTGYDGVYLDIIDAFEYFENK